MTTIALLLALPLVYIVGVVLPLYCQRQIMHWSNEEHRLRIEALQMRVKALEISK